jgi:hypothetical protein
MLERYSCSVNVVDNDGHVLSLSTLYPNMWGKIVSFSLKSLPALPSVSLQTFSVPHDYQRRAAGFTSKGLIPSTYTSCYSCNININSCIGTNLETATHNFNAGIDELMTQVTSSRRK